MIFSVFLLIGLLGLVVKDWLGELLSSLVVGLSEWDSSNSSWDESLGSSNESLWGGDNSGDDWLLDVLDSLDWLLDDLLLDDWLLDVLDSLDWLLDDLLGLDLLDWLVDDLSLNGLVLDSLLSSLLWDVLDVSVVVDLWDVLSLILDSVVVGDLLFLGDVLSGVDWLLDSLVLDFGSFVWNVFYSGLSLDWGSDLRLDKLDWLLNNLDWLLNNLDWLLDNLDWLLNNLGG